MNTHPRDQPTCFPHSSAQQTCESALQNIVYWPQAQNPDRGREGKHAGESQSVLPCRNITASSVCDPE